VKRSVLITSHARRDLLVAAQWYEAHRAGFGERLMQAVSDAVAAIGERPASFPKIYRSLRRAHVKGFPYGVFFTNDGDNCVVLGVHHLQRDPSIWRSRLK
jgi:hypothetical protein